MKKMKRYNFSLEEEDVEYLRAWLNSNGTTFSGYIRGLIRENCELLKQSGLMEQPEKMTVTQFASMFTSMMKYYSDLEKNEK